MRNKPLSFWDKLLLFFNLIAGLSLFVSYLAVKINPTDYWPPAFFGLAYPVLVVLNLFFVCYWMIHARWWFLLSLALIAAGHNYLFQTLSIGSFYKSSPPEAHKLRVLTFNAHFFRQYNRPLVASIKSQVLAMLKQEDPDIICFQEFFTRAKGQFNMRDSICLILGSRHFFIHATDSNRDEALGLAVFSRYPILSRNFIPLTTDHTSVNGVLETDIQLPGKCVRVYCVQLQSINFGPGDYAVINQLKNKIQPDLASSRHIGHQLKAAFIHRSAQSLMLAEKVAASPYPVIVCGDFNDPPVSFAVQTLSHKLTNCFAEKGTGFARTYNGKFPNFQIDYVLCAPFFQVDAYRIIKKDLSDHYPVKADLSYR